MLYNTFRLRSTSEKWSLSGAEVTIVALFINPRVVCYLLLIAISSEYNFIFNGTHKYSLSVCAKYLHGCFNAMNFWQSNIFIVLLHNKL